MAKIRVQQFGVGHGEVQDKVQRTKCENTRHRNLIFGMLEGSESKSHFLCPLKSAGSQFWYRDLESASVGKPLPALCVPQNLGLNT